MTLLAPTTILDGLKAEVVHALQDVFEDHLRAVLVKGSAVRAGGADFIHHYSDYDSAIYLDHDVMRVRRTPHVRYALALQERLSAISLESWQVSGLQFSWHDVEGFPFANQPMTGVFQVAFGALPPGFEPSTPEMQLERGFHWFAEVSRQLSLGVQGAIGADGPRLRTSARQLGGTLRATVCSAATIATRDPRRVWLSLIRDVLDIARDAAIPVGEAEEYFSAVRDWPERRHDEAWLRGRITQAVAATDGLCSWYEQHRAA